MAACGCFGHGLEVDHPNVRAASTQITHDIEMATARCERQHFSIRGIRLHLFDEKANNRQVAIVSCSRARNEAIDRRERRTERQQQFNGAQISMCRCEAHHILQDLATARIGEVGAQSPFIAIYHSIGERLADTDRWGSEAPANR